jgi:hypothetical protein
MANVILSSVEKISITNSTQAALAHCVFRVVYASMSSKIRVAGSIVERPQSDESALYPYDAHIIQNLIALSWSVESV